MKMPLYIYGAGGLGREVLSLIRILPEWEPVGFIDDGVMKDVLVNGIPILGGSEIVSLLPSGSHLIIAIGDPLSKANIVKMIIGNILYPTLIHPRAILQDISTIEVGEGSIITAGCVLTTNIKIGNHVLININATIGHDTKIGNCCSIMPGVNIAGGVTIDDCVLIGSGANIINHVDIKHSARVGMGAVVIRNVAAGITVAGVPAKPIRL